MVVSHNEVQTTKKDLSEKETTTTTTTKNELRVAELSRVE